MFKENTMKSCMDCLHCKIQVSKKTLRCTLRHWQDFGLGREIYTINYDEVGKTYMKIRDRKVFGAAISCKDYEAM
jgi:hypothetical protein